MTTPRRKPRHIWVVEDEKGFPRSFRPTKRRAVQLINLLKRSCYETYRVAKYVRAESK